MPDGAEGPPLAAPDVPVPAPELADDPEAPPLAAAPPAPPPPPPPPPPCVKTGAATAKDSAAVRRSDFRFMTFSGVKKVNDAEMTMVPFSPLASRDRRVKHGKRTLRCVLSDPYFLRRAAGSDVAAASGMPGRPLASLHRSLISHRHPRIPQQHRRRFLRGAGHCGVVAD